MKSVYRRAILTVRNLANFKIFVKNVATVDGLCGYVISASDDVLTPPMLVDTYLREASNRCSFYEDGQCESL